MLPRTTVLSLLAVACLLAACRIAPPISIGQKDSLVGQGKVLTITNTSDDLLHEVKVSVESPEGEVRIFTADTLEPHKSLSVGWLKLDGWPIPDGAEATVHCKGYLTAAGPYRVQP